MDMKYLDALNTESSLQLYNVTDVRPLVTPRIAVEHRKNAAFTEGATGVRHVWKPTLPSAVTTTVHIMQAIKDV